MIFVMRRALSVLALAVLVPACGDSGSGGGAPGPVPDFQLQDVNPNSPTATQFVSPRDYLGFVSAWNFGHAD